MLSCAKDPEGIGSCTVGPVGSSNLPGVAQQLQSWTKMSVSHAAGRIRWVPKHHEAHRFQMEDMILQLQFPKRPKLGLVQWFQCPRTSWMGCSLQRSLWMLHGSKADPWEHVRFGSGRSATLRGWSPRSAVHVSENQGLGIARFLGWCWMVLDGVGVSRYEHNVFVVLVLFDWLYQRP